MVNSCCAYGCKERFNKGGPYTLHSFPKEENRRKLWIKQLWRENFKVSNHTRICSKHFEADCFEGHSSIRRLKSNALPTIFDFPAYLVKQIKPRKRRISAIEGCLTSSTDTSASSKKYRYVGDFSERDMASPTKAHQLLLIAKSSQKKSQKKMQNLKKKNNYLTRKVSSLEDIINKMKKKSLMSDSAGSVLKANEKNGNEADNADVIDMFDDDMDVSDATEDGDRDEEEDLESEDSDYPDTLRLFALSRFESKAETEPSCKFLQNRKFRDHSLSLESVIEKGMKRPAAILDKRFNVKRLLVMDVPNDVTLNQLCEYFPDAIEIGFDVSSMHRSLTVGFLTVEKAYEAFMANKEIKINGHKLAVIHSTPRGMSELNRGNTLKKRKFMKQEEEKQ